MVTDRGLLSLCGVEPAHLARPPGTRPRLSRKCKNNNDLPPVGAVRNMAPRWVRASNMGAVRLQHIEANNLNRYG